MKKPLIKIPIIDISIKKDIRLCIKREDLVDKDISGNKYWKMFYTINNYLSNSKKNHAIITFGGAYSNHIMATAAIGKKFQIKTIGVIRGEELTNRWKNNPTLLNAKSRGMEFIFVTREEYRKKDDISKILQRQYPDALIVPEGGTNETAIMGIQYMLDDRTQEFDYICTPVGTGGTILGLSKYAENHQKVLGFKVVNDKYLEEKVFSINNDRNNIKIFDAHEGKYGKITDEIVKFINEFYKKYNIPLEPIYSGKMMKKLFQLIDDGYFFKGAKILAFHTGGLQGILGANILLKKQNRKTIAYEF